MMQKQKTRVPATWVVLFFAGLLFIPTAIFISTVYYPGQDILLDPISSYMYSMGFVFLTISFAWITGRKDLIGASASVCGAIMVVASMIIGNLMLTSVLTITLAGTGMFFGGVAILIYTSLPPKKGKQKRSQESPQPPTRRLAKVLKGFACVAILLVAGDCVPGTCFAVASATGSGLSAPLNSITALTVGEITIEVISNSSVRIHDSLGTIIMLEFNGSHIILNGTVIEVPTLQPKPSEPRTANPAGATSGTFWWDSVQFAFGQYIKYNHPDRDYYRISPYIAWSKEGSRLLHYQLDEPTSAFVLGGAALAAAVIGTIIGTYVIGPPHGTIIGAIVGAVLGLYILYVREYYMLDEKGCVWWWTSRSFIDWLIGAAPALVLIYCEIPALAITITANAFASMGYLTVGRIMFYDAIGAGMPGPPYVPTSGLRRHCGSGGCFMR